jgi:hypothetical protein
MMMQNQVFYFLILKFNFKTFDLLKGYSRYPAAPRPPMRVPSNDYNVRLLTILIE